MWGFNNGGFNVPTESNTSLGCVWIRDLKIPRLKTFIGTYLSEEWEADYIL